MKWEDVNKITVEVTTNGQAFVLTEKSSYLANNKGYVRKEDNKWYGVFRTFDGYMFPIVTPFDSKESAKQAIDTYINEKRTWQDMI